MCLIVDNNVARRVLVESDDVDFGPVHEALFRKSPGLKATLAYGGKLLQEYASNHHTMNALQALDRAGRARKIPAAEIDREAKVVIGMGIKSDDEHVLGLARVAGISLLCSHDVALHADFTNPQLVPGRGRVYQNRSHTHLLQRCRR